MNNRYRILNANGQVLCHQDSAQRAADVICNLGPALCASHYCEDLRHNSAFPFTVFQHDGFAFIGSMHGTRENALSAMRGAK